MAERQATVAEMAEDPALRADVEALLELDERAATWTFEEAPLDSGPFGELVSEGVVERVDGEYRLADPAATRAALEGDPVGVTDEDAGGAAAGSPTSPVVERLRAAVADVDVDRSVAGALAAALTVVFVARSYVYGSVFRDEAIVYLGNDAYYYRFWIRELATAGAGPFAVPAGIETGEPLLVAVVWGVTALLGGGRVLGVTVLAWYPVVAALATGVFVYLTGTRLTDDRRVGLASVVLLGVTPVHAYRSALGFADHHAFDAAVLALTLLALVTLTRAGRDAAGTGEWRTRREALWAVVLGVAIAGQTLSWNAGPILLVPVAVFAVTWVAATLDGPVSPARTMAYPAAGVCLGAAVSVLGYVGAGWQRPLVVGATALLAGGVVVVAGAGAVLRRTDVSPAVGRSVLVGVATGVPALAWVAFPSARAEAVAEFEQLILKTGQQSINEVTGLFDGAFGLLVTHVFFFGLLLYVAAPYAAWTAWRGLRDRRPEWVVVGSYGVVLLLLAAIRVRFGTHLAVAVSLYAGLGFVHLAAVVTDREVPSVLSGETDDARSGRDRGPARADGDQSGETLSVPDRSTVLVVAGLFLFVAGLGAIMTPIGTAQFTPTEAEYRSAMVAADYAEDRDWSYPTNYVFSDWDENRMYNAHVSGESRRYAYARQNYPEFLTAAAPGEWYQRLQPRSFVVTKRFDDESPFGPDSLYVRLHEEYGNGTARYRLLYAAEDGSRNLFALVPGALVRGSGTPGHTYTLRTTVSVPSGVTFTYERTVTAGEDGSFRVRVPYPGEYVVGNQTVVVPEAAVSGDQTVRVTVEEGS